MTGSGKFWTEGTSVSYSITIESSSKSDGKRVGVSRTCMLVVSDPGTTIIESSSVSSSSKDGSYKT